MARTQLDDEQLLVNQLLKSFGIDCEAAKQPKAASRQIRAQLKTSFREVSQEEDPLKRELCLQQEAKRLGIPLEDYRCQYERQTRKISINTLISRLWRWTGIPDKKLWDAVQLLSAISVPILLAVLSQSISADNARQETLNKYYEFMSGLLNENEQKPIDQTKSQQNVTELTSKAWIVARARTLTALRVLDDSRKVQLLNFLQEAGLIKKKNPKILMRDANLQNLDLSNRNLSEMDLSGADLRGSNLSGTNLISTNLISAKMDKVLMSQTDLRDANLSGAELDNSSIMTAMLCNTKMPKVDEELNNRDCRNVSGGYVDTKGGVGLNVRSGPGLNYPIVGAVPDGRYLATVGGIVYSDGYAWEQLPDGSWVQSDYLY